MVEIEIVKTGAPFVQAITRMQLLAPGETLMPPDGCRDFAFLRRGV